MKRKKVIVRALGKVTIITVYRSLVTTEDFAAIMEALYDSREVMFIVIDIRKLTEIRWPGISALISLNVHSVGRVRFIGPNESLPMLALLKLAWSIVPRCYDSPEDALVALLDESMQEAQRRCIA